MNTQDLIASVDRETPFDPWMEAALDLEQAAQTLDLEPWIVERLRNCESESVSNLLLQADDGAARIFRALRVAYTSTYPRRLCEIRISPDAGLHATRAAALRSTLAAALFNIEISGCAATLVANPAELSEHELHSLVDAYARIAPHAAEPLDRETVVIPSEGANDYVLAWLASATSSRHVSASDRSDAAALALAHVIRRLHRAQCAPKKDASRTLRFAIQGYSELESSLAREIVRKGGLLVALADVSGAIMDPEGLDLRAIDHHLEREEFILGCQDATAISTADLVACECDVLVLGSGKRQVLSEEIRAALVIECAPQAIARETSPTVGHADRVLPYLFTAGLRLAAAVQQYDSNSLACRHRRHAELKIAACHALDAIMRCAAEREISLAHAAPVVALSRLSRHMRMQGF